MLEFLTGRLTFEKNQEEITISLKMAPKSEMCRLVATAKDENDVQITVLHQEDGFVYFPLSELKEQRNDIVEYIASLHSEIVAGAYQTRLVDMEKEEICC